MRLFLAGLRTGRGRRSRRRAGAAEHRHLPRAAHVTAAGRVDRRRRPTSRTARATTISRRSRRTAASILFTSIRDDGQSDIYRYDLAAKHDRPRDRHARERILGDGDAGRQALLGDSRGEGFGAAAVELRAGRHRSADRRRRRSSRSAITPGSTADNLALFVLGQAERARPRRPRDRRARHAGAEHRPLAPAVARSGGVLVHPAC